MAGRAERGGGVKRAKKKKKEKEKKKKKEAEWEGPFFVHFPVMRDNVIPSTHARTTTRCTVRGCVAAASAAPLGTERDAGFRNNDASEISE